MTQHSIDHLFDDMQNSEIPMPDASARSDAISKAKLSFDQAFSDPARPKTKSNDSFLRSIIMSIFSKEPLGTGFTYTFATLAVVGIAVPILISYNSSNNNSLTSALPSIQVEQAPKEDADIVADAFTDFGAEADLQLSPPSSLEEVVISGSRISRSEMEAPVTIESRHAAHKTQQSTAKTERLENDYAKPTRSFDKLGETQKTMARQSIKPSPVDNLQRSLTIRPDLAEQYAEYERNGVILVSEKPISTFSADVDTAAYSLVRNQLNRGFLPAQQAVRPEEFINYFNYSYPMANSRSQPFKPTINVLDSPWNQGKKLIHIGIKGYNISVKELPDSNIVFLIDVSGSMGDVNKLPLAIQSISFLLNTLKPTDSVSIAVYAGAAGVVLEPTPAKEKVKIKNALSQLSAGGSTAGGAGIELAYQLAQQNFDTQAVNRVILLTDGDFNVGQSSNQALLELVERKRESGVLLSVMGFGRNNYQDDMMQTLAQNGNGIAAYIDTLSEAKKVMVDEATSSLFPIAKDVKFQVEFNPAAVSDYRLIGYETRALAATDFNNDQIDAGDIGAGHTVTAIYEITPRNSDSSTVDRPRYEGNKSNTTPDTQNEYGFLKTRYKLPNEKKSTLVESPIPIFDSEPTKDISFSLAVAGFAQLLNGDKNAANLSFDQVLTLAKKNKGSDEFGYRAEFIQLVEMAKLLN